MQSWSAAKHRVQTTLSAVLLVCGCAGQDVALPELRRIVTVEDHDGSAVVLADDAGSNVVMLNGSRIVRLWETTGMPVALDIAEDRGATAGNAYREGFTGSSFYIAEIPPGSDLGDIPLHRQESLDYIAVLEGEIVLALPAQRLTMRRGDLLVQAGTMHGWINETDEPCRLLVVVLTGKRGTL